MVSWLQSKLEGRDNLVFSLVEFFYWSANVVYYNFIVTYLTNQGYSDFMCGVVTTCTALTVLVVQPTLGYLTDTFITAKKLLIITMALSVPAVFLLPNVLFSPVLVILSAVLMACLNMSSYTTIEIWIVKLQATRPTVVYSFCRAFGSLGFALSALCFGKVMAAFGDNMLFVVHAFFLVLMIFAMLFAEEVPCTNSRSRGELKESGGKQDSFFDVFKYLLTNRRYMIFVASLFLFHITLRCSITFLPMHIREAGGTSTALGVAIFVYSFAEYLIILFGGRLLLRRLSYEQMFALALVFQILRQVSFVAYSSVPFIVATQLLHAISDGLYLKTFAEYIYSIVPRKIAATASSIAVALTFGLGSVFGNFVGGILIEEIGLRAYSVISGLVCVAGLCIFLPSLLGSKTLQKSAQPAAE